MGTSIKSRMENARRHGHDSLGLRSDPETLLDIARTSKDRFLATGAEEPLSAWISALQTLLEIKPPVEGLSREWISVQLTELVMLSATFRKDTSLLTQILATADISTDAKTELLTLCSTLD